ncbi:MAG TPA: sugar-binding domain-containing protein [Burkholderiales bacterium]|nr:sugar-binding domain-containing protein [Burkholderiales bacterium]
MAAGSALMVKVCHYYYRDQLTMAEIGERLGISRHRVGRLLKEAVDTGVVKIEIHTNSGEITKLEGALEKAFGLKTAVVAEVAADWSPEDVKRATCKAGAEFLRELLSPHHTIGVGWGSTTFELVNQLEPLKLADATVVQITGGNKRLSMQFDCHEVTRRLAQKLGVRPVLLHAPGIVDKKQTRELLMRESAITETLKYFDEIDIAIVGVGALVPEIQSMLIRSGYVSSTELESLKCAGAIGDVFSYFVDDEGRIVRTELYDRLITIDLQHIRKVPTTVGVAAGAVKAQAVAAAIRGGFVNTLIVDSLLGKALLEQHHQGLASHETSPRAKARAGDARITGSHETAAEDGG